MIAQKKNKTGLLLTIVFIVGLLALSAVLENVMDPESNKKAFSAFKVLQMIAVYALAACSMNLLNGFTGLFSLGQAGFMLLGAYTYAILTIPNASKPTVYYLYHGSDVKFSLTDLFGGVNADGLVDNINRVQNPMGLVLAVLLALILAGVVAAAVAWLIGLPVLRLKSDYLAIATLGFAEIIRAVFQWDKLGRITNGANALKSFPTFYEFNIVDVVDPVAGTKKVRLYLATFAAFLIAALCIALILMLINSSYGRAFKSIREDEIAAEAMGINLAKHKRMSFCISSFFAGISGGLFAMFAQAQAKSFTTALTYDILLIVVIGGIGSISGSCIGAFLYLAVREWLLRFLDTKAIVAGYEVPLLGPGFRMVVVSVIIMIVVLFFRKGIMGDKELPDLFKRRPKAKKAAAGQKGGGQQ